MYEIIGTLIAGLIWLVVAISIKNKTQIVLSIFCTLIFVLGLLFGFIGALFGVGAYLIYAYLIKNKNVNTTK
jgi:prepilin signal peptidase PulO-like enzyme (type II secretory pathway)